MDERVIEAGGGRLMFRREAFDSDIFGLEIGRITSIDGDARALLARVVDEVGGTFDQVIRRTTLEAREEIWALEASGYELMDVGTTLIRQAKGTDEGDDDDSPVVVRPCEEADLPILADGMAEEPWGSRYESDPTYAPEQIQELRRRWLANSYHGRAASFLVSEVEGRPAAFVISLLDADSGHGEIDLVGTLPEFRSLGAASRTLRSALSWLSTRTDTVTVRTQATNYPALKLYQKWGFRAHAADATWRLSIQGVYK